MEEDSTAQLGFAAFEGAVLRMKEVLGCNLVAGDFDDLLKIRVRDIEDFNKLHGQKLIALPGVRQTRTFFVMKTVEENAHLPFRPHIRQCEGRPAQHRGEAGRQRLRQSIVAIDTSHDGPRAPATTSGPMRRSAQRPFRLDRLRAETP